MGVGGPSGDYADDAEAVTVDADEDGLVTFAVVNLGWVGMDADDPLTAETFTITIAEAEQVPAETGCGCEAVSGVGAMGIGIGAVPLWRRRRAAPTAPSRSRAARPVSP